MAKMFCFTFFFTRFLAKKYYVYFFLFNRKLFFFFSTCLFVFSLTVFALEFCEWKCSILSRPLQFRAQKCCRPFFSGIWPQFFFFLFPFSTWFFSKNAQYFYFISMENCSLLFRIFIIFTLFALILRQKYFVLLSFSLDFWQKNSIFIFFVYNGKLFFSFSTCSLVFFLNSTGSSILWIKIFCSFSSSSISIKTQKCFILLHFCT